LKGRKVVVERVQRRKSAGPPAPARAPAPGRRERNKQEKLDRIVAAARHLFDTKGFAETTTQEIAERADIGTGTLFLYAKSKEDLLIMVFRDEMIETSQAAFSRLPPNASLRDQLMHVFGMMIAYHDRDPDLSRILLKEIMFPPSPERREDVRSLMRVIYDGIAGLVAAGQRTGRLRPDIDADLAAQNLFAVYYMSLIIWLTGDISKARFIQQLGVKLAITVEGLAAPL
jgi:AcrR family transcriptional regulator